MTELYSYLLLPTILAARSGCVLCCANSPNIEATCWKDSRTDALLLAATGAGLCSPWGRSLFTGNCCLLLFWSDNWPWKMSLILFWFSRCSFRWTDPGQAKGCGWECTFCGGHNQGQHCSDGEMGRTAAREWHGVAPADPVWLHQGCTLTGLAGCPLWGQGTGPVLGLLI